MPKTVDDLIQSRAKRVKIIEQMGAIPESIMRHDRSLRAIDLMVNDRNYDVLGYNDPSAGHTDQIAKAFSVSGKTCRGKGAALSRFPQNIGRMLLLLYTDEGDTVVDPFAGHNSRFEMCWRANRNYMGNELSREFMDANRKIVAMLEQEAKADMFGASTYKATITLTEGDSRDLPFPDECGDFTITSPPYWCVEHYGDEPEQLGNNSYENFLADLGLVIQQNYRCLKPGAFCVWCVNDFRMDGKFYSYHEDTASLLRAAGFYQWDIAITDLGPTIRYAFAQQIVDQMILPKRHEYCLIFRKPE